MLVEGLTAAGITCGVRSPLLDQPVDSWDLQHCHDARSHTFARRPFVVSRRVGFPVQRTLISQWKYSRAAAYLAVSNYVADELGQAGVPASKIFVVPDAIRPIPPADRSTGRILLLSKNGQTVPGAVAVRDLREDLRECDVFIYLSDMEGLGSAALLAQAAGVPVIASRAGGLPEAVKFGTVIDHVDQVRRAIDETREMTVDPEAILREFSVERMVERTLAVYRKVLSC
ncbi:MAG: glycosyltransferase family 4 protein [Acidobacteria bacterium]|nr:glycosyltransferase family 4 protein [Acidobacteriota bacterium]